MTNRGQKTPLHKAAQMADHDLLTKLLQDGENANVNDTDAYGNTPLHFAADRGNSFDVVVSLLIAGADVKAKDDDGMTPLDLARDASRRIEDFDPQIVPALEYLKDPIRHPAPPSIVAALSRCPGAAETSALGSLSIASVAAPTAPELPPPPAHNPMFDRTTVVPAPLPNNFTAPAAHAAGASAAAAPMQPRWHPGMIPRSDSNMRSAVGGAAAHVTDVTPNLGRHEPEAAYLGTGIPVQLPVELVQTVALEPSAPPLMQQSFVHSHGDQLDRSQDRRAPTGNRLGAADANKVAVSTIGVSGIDAVREMLAHEPSLLQHAQLLADAGVSCRGDLALLDDAELKDLGISMIIHRKKLLAMGASATQNAAVAAPTANGGNVVETPTRPNVIATVNTSYCDDQADHVNVGAGDAGDIGSTAFAGFPALRSEPGEDQPNSNATDVPSLAGTMI